MTRVGTPEEVSRLAAATSSAGVTTVSILRFQDGQSEARQDAIAVEEPL
jgi:hypothetical protein